MFVLTKRLCIAAAVLGMTFIPGATLIAPVSAHAADYHAFLCAIPPGDTGEGSEAPTDGMTYSVNGAYLQAGSSCNGGGGSMYALMDGTLTHAYSATAEDTFTAPTGLSITGFNLWRYEEDGPSQPYGSPATNLWYTGVISVEGLCTDGCTSRGVSSPWYASRNEISDSNLSGVGAIHWAAACGGGPGGTCPESGTTYSSQYDVYSLDVIMEDPSSPTVSLLDGAILAGGTFSGSQNISFTANDSGSGVYSAWIAVDGATKIGPTILNTNGGLCKDLGATKDGLRSFLRAQPCPASASGLLTLNTATLKDGSHTASLYVDDAAGNQTIASTWTFTSQNAPVTQTAPSVSGTAEVGQTLTATNGTFTAPTSAGALSSIAGQWTLCNATGEKCSPISGATEPNYTPIASDAGHTIAYRDTVSDNDGTTNSESPPTLAVKEAPGSTTSCSGPCQTSPGNNTPSGGGVGGDGSGGPGGAGGSSGSLTVNLTPPGSSLTTTLLGNTIPWKTSLQITPRRVRRHELIHLSGRVSTFPRPPEGKLVYLQARTVNHTYAGHKTTYGRWITFKVTRTEPNGQFHVKYKFRLGGDHTYQFQAVAPAEGGYRDPAGSSNILAVVEH